jgi:hypothetical protein
VKVIDRRSSGRVQKLLSLAFRLRYERQSRQGSDNNLFCQPGMQHIAGNLTQGMTTTWVPGVVWLLSSYRSITSSGKFVPRYPWVCKKSLIALEGVEIGAADSNTLSLKKNISFDEVRLFLGI